MIRLTGKESCKIHWVSRGCSFTVTVPNRLSRLKNPLEQNTIVYSNEVIKLINRIH